MALTPLERQRRYLAKMAPEDRRAHWARSKRMRRHHMPRKTNRRLWCETDVVRLKELWPKYPRRDIIKAFPHRSWMAIGLKARSLGLRRQRNIRALNDHGRARAA